MSNEDGRSIGSHLNNCALNLVLCSAVYRASSIVEKKNAWCCQQCSGQGDTLSLSPGKHNPTRTDHCAVAVLEIHDKLMCLSCFRRFLDHLLRRVRISKGNILSDGTRKQENILLDHRDLSPERGE